MNTDKYPVKQLAAQYVFLLEEETLNFYFGNSCDREYNTNFMSMILRYSWGGWSVISRDASVNGQSKFSKFPSIQVSQILGYHADSLNVIIAAAEIESKVLKTVDEFEEKFSPLDLHNFKLSATERAEANYFLYDKKGHITLNFSDET